MAKQFISIRNWETYQHYKERNPPWVKLHRSLMQSITWVIASDQSRVLAIALMALAGQHDNRIPYDAAYIKRVCYLNQDPDFSELFQLEFIDLVDVNGVAIKPHTNASKSHTNALPETEKEKETEQSTEKKTLSAVADGRYKPFIEDLDKYWTTKNPGVPFALSPADCRNLKQFLRDNPKVDRELFRRCLNHRARSPAVHSQKVHKWILNVLEYANGKLDRFNKPETSTGKSEPIRRANADAEAESLATFGITDADRELLQTGSIAGRKKSLAGTADESPLDEGEGCAEEAHGKS